MDGKQAALYDFFTEKAKRLQDEIDLETAKAGGELMLPYRVDLLYWVEKCRDQIENCRLIRRMLKDQPEGIDTETVLRKLQETMETDRITIDELRRKREEIEKTMNQLHEEAEYYRMTLEFFGR